MIKEIAYAKVNLTLEILGKRSDGYHELESLIVPIDLYDVLYFELSDVDQYIGIDIKNNNILKTLDLFKKTYNIDKCVKITLEKNIPIEAGLAGGSADSSAVLRGLNRLFNLNLSLEELSDLASKLGSDNPYCVYQRPMIMRGRGEILESVDFKLDKQILLIKPNFGASTKLIFSNFKKSLQIKTNLDNLVIFNDLEEVTLNLYEELKNLFLYIKNLGYTPHMSGSGPTLFVIGDDLLDLSKKLENLNIFTFLTKFI